MARGAAQISFGVAGGVLILLVQNNTYWGRSKVEGISSSKDFLPRNLDLVLNNRKERSKGWFDNSWQKEFYEGNRNSEGNLFLRIFLVLKKFRSEFCWGGIERGRREPVRHSFEQKWLLTD